MAGVRTRPVFATSPHQVTAIYLPWAHLVRCRGLNVTDGANGLLRSRVGGQCAWCACASRCE